MQFHSFFIAHCLIFALCTLLAVAEDKVPTRALTSWREAPHFSALQQPMCKEADEKSVRAPVRASADETLTNKSQYPRFAHAVAGAGGGLVTVLLLHPLDTVKTRLQSDGASRTGSAVRMFRSIVLSEGVCGLYRGAVPAMFGSIASWAFYMHWFHMCRGLLASRLTGKPTPWTDFAAGTTAGLMTAVATNPIWVVKVRLQLQQKVLKGPGLNRAIGPVGTVVYSGFFDGLRRIALNEGVRGLYKGLGPSLWLVSHGAIQFTLYEHCKRILASLSHSHWVPLSSISVPASTSNASSQATNGTSVRDSLLASSGSKLIASAATYPIQLVRTRMQELGPSSHLYSNMMGSFVRVLKQDGARGLYRGFGANVARVVPQSALTIVTYEQLLKLYMYAYNRGLLPG